MHSKFYTYFIGIFWFTLSLLSSSINDIISKYSGLHLHSYEITFFRFAFGAIILIPSIIYYGISNLKTNQFIIHVIRGMLLSLGIVCWTYGLSIVPVTTATVVSFTIPIFTLVIGAPILNEHIIWQRWFATIIVCIGLITTLDLHTKNFHPEVMIFIIAAVCFAILDIINKKFAMQETIISMLFYSTIITAFITFPLTIQHWSTPSNQDLILLVILGVNSNLILLFLLKAFKVMDASALAPYRYFELVISTIISYLVFKELPTKSFIFSSLVIIPSTLFIIHTEKRLIDKSNNY